MERINLKQADAWRDKIHDLLEETAIAVELHYRMSQHILCPKLLADAIARLDSVLESALHCAERVRLMVINLDTVEGRSDGD